MSKRSWAFLKKSDAVLQTFWHFGERQCGIADCGLLQPKKCCVMTTSCPPCSKSFSQERCFGVATSRCWICFSWVHRSIGCGIPACCGVHMMFHSSTVGWIGFLLFLPFPWGCGPPAMLSRITWAWSMPGGLCCTTFSLLSLLGWGEERVAASHGGSDISCLEQLFACANYCNFSFWHARTFSGFYKATAGSPSCEWQEYN